MKTTAPAGNGFPRQFALLLMLFSLSGCWLEVHNNGDPGGTVTSTVIQSNLNQTQPGIQCGRNQSRCTVTYLYEGAEQLVATPAPGYVFAGWSGACAGQGPTCTLNITSHSWHEAKAYFNVQQVTLDNIADQQVNQDFHPFTLQASAASSGGPISWSVRNSRPDAVDVSIDASNGLLTLAPVPGGFGNAEIEVVASINSGQSASTRFSLVVAMPTHAVFACGTGVETQTGDTLPGSYTLFEAGQTRPLATSPNGRYLFVANTPANCLEIYNIEQDTPQLISSVAVGLEPVAVAARTDTEIWVVNALSDSVSIVDIRHRPHVKQTLLVGDEPRDIVFAGPDRKAFITAAYRGQNHPTFAMNDMFTAGIGRGDVWVFDGENPGSGLGGTPITILRLFTDAARALAVSPDGNTVYAAGFMTGNRTTVIEPLAAMGNKPGPFTNVDGAAAPDSALIVRFNGTDWVDERNTVSWNSQVKFSLPDQDVFVIDASPPVPALTGTTHSGVGTSLFNMTTAPDGRLFVSNTEARNHVRFEGPGYFVPSTLRGHVVENRVTIIDGDSVTPYELNHHIDFNLPFGSQVSAEDKYQSVAQPSEMAYINNELWVLSSGSDKIQIYADPKVTGRGSWFDSPWFSFVGLVIPGGGPTGIAVQDYRKRAWVYSRFSHSLSVVSTQKKFVINTVPLFSPEPAAVRDGRRFLYDAQLTSGNGTSSCASCHLFGDLDGLAWDLGNPDEHVVDNPNPLIPAVIPFIPDPKFHPMKGPMTTQTLRGIADSGPMHWRGDRPGQNPVNGESLEAAAFKEFNGAFVSLLGRPGELSDHEMQLFTDFVLQLMPPPNPVRRLDDGLTATQTAGRNLYFGQNTTVVGNCNACHTLDRAQDMFGTSRLSGGSAASQVFKVPHLRNLYQKVGMFGTSMSSPDLFVYPVGPQIKGFGYRADGHVDTVGNLLTTIGFNFPGNATQRALRRREVAEFALVFDSNLKPIVGQQVTLTPDNAAAAGPRIDLLIARAQAGDCDLVAWSSSSLIGTAVSARMLPNGSFRSSLGTTSTDAQMRAHVAGSGEPVTYTCVPPGNGVRISQVY